MKNEIVLASNNRKKIAELETLMVSDSSKGIKILSLKDIGFYDEIAENGTTFEENSLIKSSAAAARGYLACADDSGLCVDALNGAPGIYSARYASEDGKDADDTENRKKLYRELADVPDEKRGGAFVCAVSFVVPESSDIVIPEEWRISAELSEKTGIPAERAMVIRDECRGVITHEDAGTGGFGYDCMFYFPEFGCTFAEIPGEKKNTVSHRGKAMREFVRRLNILIK